MFTCKKIILLTMGIFSLNNSLFASPTCEIRGYSPLTWNRYAGQWEKITPNISTYNRYKECVDVVDMWQINHPNMDSRCETICLKYKEDNVPEKCQDSKRANIVLTTIKNRNPEAKDFPIDGSADFRNSIKFSSMVTGSECLKELASCDLKASILRYQSIYLDGEPFKLYYRVECTVE